MPQHISTLCDLWCGLTWLSTYSHASVTYNSGYDQCCKCPLHTEVVQCSYIIQFLQSLLTKLANISMCMNKFRYMHCESMCVWSSMLCLVYSTKVFCSCFNFICITVISDNPMNECQPQLLNLIFVWKWWKQIRNINQIE